MEEQTSLVLESERRVQERDVVPRRGALPGRESDQGPSGRGETEREAGPGDVAKKVAAWSVNHIGPPREP